MLVLKIIIYKSTVRTWGLAIILLAIIILAIYPRVEV